MEQQKCKNQKIILHLENDSLNLEQTFKMISIGNCTELE